MEAMVVTNPEIIEATKWQKIPSWKLVTDEEKSNIYLDPSMTWM